MAELSECVNSTGSDVKAFCCSPVHSLVIAAGMVQAGIFRNVVVVGGGSLAKLGMKFRGHLNHPMPVLEDVLGAMAFLVAPDDGRSPQVRLDCVGKHDVISGSSPQAIMEALVVKPLEKVGLRLGDVEKYAVELHNPEVTEPAGSGNVPRTNYRMIASLAVLRGEIAASELEAFAEEHGMPGFSPTQGHIAAGVPFLGHAYERVAGGALERAMFVAKGSLFLGRMTKLSDGMSFLLTRNGRCYPNEKCGSLPEIGGRDLLEVTTDTFEKEVVEHPGPVLVDFWGPACRPCLGLMPVVEEVSRRYDGRLKVVKVNAAQNRRLCINLRVMSLPTFLVYRGGQEVERLTGEVAREAVEDLAARWAENPVS
jgi:thiol-disulfide isomerase/thioredoxin